MGKLAFFSIFLKDTKYYSYIATNKANQGDNWLNKKIFNKLPKHYIQFPFGIPQHPETQSKSNQVELYTI